MPSVVAGPRRRTRAEAARSASVSVRLSPDEAAVVGEAADRAGMSVGAWMGATAVGEARAQARGNAAGEVDDDSLSTSRRELIAALVALRAEVAAARRVPAADLGPAVPVRELLDDQFTDSTPDVVNLPEVVVGVLRRIDALTAAAMDAVASNARDSLPSGRQRAERS
jgi:hypothetical protein